MDGGVGGSDQFAELFLGEVEVDDDAFIVRAPVSGGELVEDVGHPDPDRVAAEVDAVLSGHPQPLADDAAQRQRGLRVPAQESLEVRARDDVQPGRAAGGDGRRPGLLVDRAQFADDISGHADGEQ
jgi:hypothetical protein